MDRSSVGRLLRQGRLLV